MDRRSFLRAALIGLGATTVVAAVPEWLAETIAPTKKYFLIGSGHVPDPELNLDSIGAIAINFIQPNLRSIVYGKSNLFYTLAKKRSRNGYPGRDFRMPETLQVKP